MDKVDSVLTFFLLTSLGLGCGGGGLNSGGSGGAAGAGQGGTNGGGSGAGVGGAVNSGGTTSGGATSSTGGSATGGKGGANAGGSATGGKGGMGGGGISGAGGTICPPVLCLTLGCPYGTVPNPDPCGCPICAGPDAGVSKDSAPDACFQLPCAYPLCAPGYVVSPPPPCGCPTCVPADAGAPDATVCPFFCPAIKCANGYLPTHDACGCTTCTAADAGTDTGKLDCVGLDECTCGATKSCSVIAEACYCPYPQCSSAGACVCGGGKYIGCAPATLATCSAAKARVTTLCPQLKGTILDSLCQQPDSACITKCLDEVTSCGEVSCSFCEACDCVGDPFMQCRAKCNTALTQ